MEYFAAFQNFYLLIPWIIAEPLTMYCGTMVGKHWSRRLWAFIVTAFNVLTAAACGVSCGLFASTKAVGAASTLVENGTYEPFCIALWTDMQYFKTYKQ